MIKLRTMRKFQNFLNLNQFFHLNKRQFTVGSNPEEILIKSKTVEHFYPIRGIPEFQNGLYTVFENKSLDVKIPYQIKEYTIKGFLYTFFLCWGGRFLGAYTNAKIISVSMLYSFIPASVFTFFYSKIIWTMLNAVNAIRLKENGTHVIFEFKNLLSPLEVEISRLRKINSESIFYECFYEPTLYPIEIDYNDIYGKYSLRNLRTVYIYGDSHESIKNGEIFRAILNGQNIKLK